MEKNPRFDGRLRGLELKQKFITSRSFSEVQEAMKVLFDKFSTEFPAPFGPARFFNHVPPEFLYSWRDFVRVSCYQYQSSNPNIGSDYFRGITVTIFLGEMVEVFSQEELRDIHDSIFNALCLVAAAPAE